MSSRNNLIKQNHVTTICKKINKIKKQKGNGFVKLKITVTKFNVFLILYH